MFPSLFKQVVEAPSEALIKTLKMENVLDESISAFFSSDCIFLCSLPFSDVLYDKNLVTCKIF